MPLTQAEIDAYRRDGFYGPVDAIPTEEIRAKRAALEEFERTLPPGPVDRMYRRKMHVRLPWARDLVEDPRILDVIEQLIGPDILIFNATFFIKEPNTDAITAWHQDATFFGLDPYEHVTAWVAFSDSTVEAGCIQFLPGSQGWGQLHHVPHAVAGSVNASSQCITQTLDTSRARFQPLKAGQFSLHHTLVVHNSAPNRGGDRRIGLGISYIPTRCRHTGSMRMPATLVRGTDRYGHFELEPDPRTSSEPERIAAHARAFQGYRTGYDEQIERHARAFA